MATILVAGASGLLGCALVPHLRAQGHTVQTHGLTAAADFQADLTDTQETWQMLDQAMPDAIVNLAALTNVDTCELEPQQAYLLNVKVVQNIVDWIKHSGNTMQRECFLVHISSDQVYDGTGPHAETEVMVKNTYAFSKIASELAAMQVVACVLRTNFFGKSQRPGRVSFSDWLVQALRSGQEIKVFDDVLFSPLSMQTLVKKIGFVLQQQPCGVFNLGSKNGMSKADFAFALAAALNLPTASMQRSQSSNTPLKAYRPKDMRMDSQRFEMALQLSLPSLIDEINLCGRDYLENA